MNRRKYLRISTVLPVEFVVQDENGKQITPWLQGFTRDIAKAGICLVANDLWWGFWDRLKDPSSLLLKIHLPFGHRTIETQATVAWMQAKQQDSYKVYKAGLEFKDIPKNKAALLFNFAIAKKYVPRVLIASLLLLAIVSSALFLETRSLNRQNHELISDYIDIIQKSSSLDETFLDQQSESLFYKERIEEIASRIKLLDENILSKKEEYDRVSRQSRKSDLAHDLEQRIFSLESELSRLKKENDFFRAQKKKREETAVFAGRKARELEKARSAVSGKILKGMFGWIRNRQDLSTGLVISYEGDASLEEACFTYDQALAAIVFSCQGHLREASRILDFYLARVNHGQDIYNAYFSNGQVFEYVIHSGPNAWIGLAALCYTKESGDDRYIAIAQKVAGFLLSMMDSECGLKGGPMHDWYSTEHNLDAYAFFELFYELSGDYEYRRAADKIKSWIERYCYTDFHLPVKRGKGDSTIATDTYAWSIAAFGPKTLYELNMDPEVILDFAVKHCEVTAIFKRGQQEFKIQGFDFAKAKNIPRGGVVSGEWTSQMILSFEIMAEYFKDINPAKSKIYFTKARFYTDQLGQMIITSLSASGKQDPCLPYATSPFIDTGHGWRTPKGDKTGSLSSTAYFLLASYGYNPLKAEFLEVSLFREYTDNFYEKTRLARVKDNGQ
ncbi:MAG: PilZ domain-containing protein [Candidatus Omnitrophica bacterium]|nr:PilZ domain-containing protein [Candidatus Omnitrophota bacterium]MDD5430489.1 PilZ domain-containing protein [Candidatus Omnitrophota bacterium]